MKNERIGSQAEIQKIGWWEVDRLEEDTANGQIGRLVNGQISTNMTILQKLYSKAEKTTELMPK